MAFPAIFFPPTTLLSCDFEECAFSGVGGPCIGGGRNDVTHYQGVSRGTWEVVCRNVNGKGARVSDARRAGLLGAQRVQSAQDPVKILVPFRQVGVGSMMSPF